MYCRQMSMLFVYFQNLQAKLGQRQGISHGEKDPEFHKSLYEMTHEANDYVNKL